MKNQQKIAEIFLFSQKCDFANVVYQMSKKFVNFAKKKYRNLRLWLNFVAYHAILMKTNGQGSVEDDKDRCVFRLFGCRQDDAD